MDLITKTNETEKSVDDDEPPDKILDLVEIAKTLQKDSIEEMKKKFIEEDRNPYKEFKEYNIDYQSDKKYVDDLELLTFKGNFEMPKPRL